MQHAAPVEKDIVLIGGGHAHLAVIKAFAMRPEPGVRLTVISEDMRTPYSGMLPGLIRGEYTADESYIDLNQLTRWGRIDFICDKAVNIDPVSQEVILKNRPPVAYNVLSVNIGSTPPITDIEEAAEYAFPVKPIQQFLKSLQKLEKKNVAHPEIVIAGAGAGGIETAISLHAYFEHKNNSASITLISDTDDILPGHGASVRRQIKEALVSKNITLRFKARAIANNEAEVTLHTGEKLTADFFVLATGAAAPNWLALTGLATNENGFLKINSSLQSRSHPDIFAAGDCAEFSNSPVAKSGVYAVRQGPLLAQNLRRAALGMPLLKWRPQKRTLAIITTGHKTAVASYGKLAFSGRWVWKWKDILDRRWMARYSQLPPMPTASSETAQSQEINHQMRCGGCGAKISSPILRRVLKRLGLSNNTGDDAAIITPPPGAKLVQTVDHFRAFLGDPYLFGEISTKHALSDIYAMGAKPSSALVTAILPFGSESATERDLLQLLTGVKDALEQAGATLVGGHTGEGAELALGLSVNGFIANEMIKHKAGAELGDHIILTKPIGLGAILAANMHAAADHSDFEEAILQMRKSNEYASKILADLGTHALTDVTGFGLAGHLIEMADGASLSAQIKSDSIPYLSGAIKALKAGIESTMAEPNSAFASRISNLLVRQENRLLFDPQTSGGLLAAIPAQSSELALNSLRSNGYPEAKVIGTFIERSDSYSIQLV